MRRLNRIETCGESLRAALDEIAAISPDFAAPAPRGHWPSRSALMASNGRPGEEPDTEWVGATCHLSESCDEDLPNLITYVHTTPATDPDVTATTAIQDKFIARDLAPAEHLMDAGYPRAENVAASATRGVTLIASVVTATGRNAKKGAFTPAEFTS